MDKLEKLNIVVVGTGVYVCGRGTDGYGTVMPALLEYMRSHDLGDIYIAGTGSKSINTCRKKVNRLMTDMRVEPRVIYLTVKPKNGYKDLFRNIPRPALCIAVVPDDIHKDIAIAAMEAGLHALVVKPLAPTLKEVKAIVKAQEKAGLYGAVEFHKRLDHANLKLKDVIARGAIGDPLYFLVEYSQKKSVPYYRFSKWVKQTNIFQYLGIHYVDIIYFATKASPIRVMATGQKGWLVSKGVDTYDAIQAVIEWRMPSGKTFSSSILTNWIDPESSSAVSDQKIKVIGTMGRFESDQKKRGVTIVTDSAGVEEPNPYFCSPYGTDPVSYKGYGIDSICQFIADVADIADGRITIKALESLRPTFKESVVPSAVIEAVNKSLKNNGNWVNIAGV